MTDEAAACRTAPVRAVLFDWGDTLVRYPGFSTAEGGHLEAVDALFARLATDAEAECFARAGTTCVAFTDAYRRASEDQFAMMASTGTDQPMGLRIAAALADCGCTCGHGPDVIERYLGHLFDELAGRTSVMPGAVELLTRLTSGRGTGTDDMRVAVVSNYPEPSFVHRTLALHGLARFFDVVVVSADVGRMKPDPLPFSVAMDRVGVAAGEVLVVGDDLRSDMAGAARLGCRTAWLHHGRGARATSAQLAVVDHLLDDLTALSTVLEALPPRSAHSRGNH